MNKKSEEFFIKYLKTLPNSHIKQFYNDVEWTPYHVLVIKEFQRRFKPNDTEFLDKLLKSVDDAKNVIVHGKLKLDPSQIECEWDGKQRNFKEDSNQRTLNFWTNLWNPLTTQKRKDRKLESLQK